jgi:polysaccharide export outer membrane protein|uniref:Polysaccharide export protein n=1 Tax=Desulfobacca acetoxidans TaxID=60893 RepID=A0A7V6A614_9BACT
MKAANFLNVLKVLAIGCGVVLLSQPQPVLAQMAGMQQASLQSFPATSNSSPKVNPDDYVVGSEDLLDVQFFGQEDLNRQVRVDGEGEITLPLVGAVKVAGFTPKAIEKRLMQAYGARYLRNPQINLAVKEYRHQRVSVTGAVDKPGYYEIIGPRKLLEVLAMAGGLQGKGADSKAGDVVQVIREHGNPHTLIIDLKRLQVQGDPALNVTIHGGDVVHIPFAGNAYVLGGVRAPGSVAVRDNLTLSQALAVAGGADPVLANNQITIMRLDENRNPTTITAHLNKVLSHQEPDIPLKDNDVVVVNVSSFKKGLYVFNRLIPGGGGSVSGAYRFAP